MKILIVEDEILIQKSIAKILEKKGHIVQACVSGREAIKLIMSHDYDRIVCDLMLQDITGFDIIEEVKKKYDQTQIACKFVIMTAYSSETVLENAKKYNCPVLNKPFKDLNKAIETMLK